MRCRVFRVLRRGELARALPLRKLPPQHLVPVHHMVRCSQRGFFLYRKDTENLCVVSWCAPHVLRRLRNPDRLRARQVSARDSSVCSEPGRSRGFSARFSCVLERTAALAALERWASQIRDYTGWSTAVEGGLSATIPAQRGSYLSSKPASLSVCPELVERLRLFWRLRAEFSKKEAALRQARGRRE